MSNELHTCQTLSEVIEDIALHQPSLTDDMLSEIINDLVRQAYRDTSTNTAWIDELFDVEEPTMKQPKTVDELWIEARHDMRRVALVEEREPAPEEYLDHWRWLCAHHDVDRDLVDEWAVKLKAELGDLRP